MPGLKISSHRSMPAKAGDVGKIPAFVIEAQPEAHRPVSVDEPGDVETQKMALDIEAAAAVQVGFELVDGRVGKAVAGLGAAVFCPESVGCAAARPGIAIEPQQPATAPTGPHSAGFGSWGPPR
jgi:hypothetical protein